MMRRINREMNEQMVELLELKGDERVLEIGFGPGVGVELLLAALPDGAVAGADASPLMLRQASRRNAAAIGAGRADLRQALATELPFADASVDAACSANSVQLWGDLDRAFAELARVLVPGGRIVLTVHDWAADDLDGRIRTALAANPFEAVDVRNTVDASGTTIHVTARRSRTGRPDQAPAR
jgi:ubiquinone/menaquinone biosynthesis C-methylase UbiE